MKNLLTFIFLTISVSSFGQLTKDEQRISITIWRDSTLDEIDTIKLVEIKSMDTLINIHTIEDRYIYKIPLNKNFKHELDFIIGTDTMNFSFLNLESYISKNSPVSSWTIRIFSDINYAKRFYETTAIADEISSYKRLYSFTCDLCSTTFNPKR